MMGLVESLNYAGEGEMQSARKRSYRRITTVLIVVSCLGFVAAGSLVLISLSISLRQMVAARNLSLHGCDVYLVGRGPLILNMGFYQSVGYNRDVLDEATAKSISNEINRIRTVSFLTVDATMDAGAIEQLAKCRSVNNFYFGSRSFDIQSLERFLEACEDKTDARNRNFILRGTKITASDLASSKVVGRFGGEKLRTGRVFFTVCECEEYGSGEGLQINENVHVLVGTCCDK